MQATAFTIIANKAVQKVKRFWRPPIAQQPTADKDMVEAGSPEPESDITSSHGQGTIGNALRKRVRTMGAYCE
jgi:hypothetical protein